MSSIISNLPSRTPRILAFLDSDLIVKFRFPDNYPITNVSAKIYFAGRFREDLVTTTKSGSTVTIKVTKQNLQSINFPVSTLFLYNNGVSILTSVIETKFSSDGTIGQEFSLTLTDGIDVEVGFIDTRENLEYTERAEQAAIEAETALNGVETVKVSVDQTAISVEQDRQIVVSKAQEVEEAISNASNLLSDPLPATYANMVTLLRLGKRGDYTVQNDEFQGVEQVPYYWNGVKLFVYGTLVDPQPVVTQ